MKKTLLSLALASMSHSLFAQEIPDECKTFLADAENMFKVIGLDAKLAQAELTKYQREMQNIDPIKLPRMCSDATEAIKEQLPDLEKQADQLKSLKQAAEKPSK